MHDGPDAHEHVTEADMAASANFIWAQDNVELTTVGIDIGSSTSHLLFAKLYLRRQSQGLSSRFHIIRRDVLFKSKICLTPFLNDGTIDVEKLGAFINTQYQDAGLTPDMVDTGAVILTGEAIKRRNAAAIDELFASQGGKFVCATAGHKLEATLAAHGSGAVEFSRRTASCVLHVDVGGGTTKLALIDNGFIRSVSTFAVGGRLIAQDEDGAWTRLDESALLVAADLGLELTPIMAQSADIRQAIIERLADCAVGQITGSAPNDLGQKLQLTGSLRLDMAPTAISFSGGVAEYLFSRETNEFGDIAKPLAEALRTRLSIRSPELVDPGQGIRATVIGASQFAVQVSGKTIYFSDESHLQVHNIPVKHIPNAFTARFNASSWQTAVKAALQDDDRGVGGCLALAFSWRAPPEYRHIHACAEGILQAVSTNYELLLLVVDGDIGRSLGFILREELNYNGPLISLDGLELQQFDFVDIGGLMQPAGVVPVIVKSLVFS
ncbi:MAG: reactivating factor for ethanolamine ammonia lyase [Acidocella sp. 20-57-95]|nr:MAG: reactivating factor for ethanolamine ammonia lyase [Acidocella sp. 20-57-95]HQT64004.1 ethanolamine ammonia-lyase reactivating factor EutA [Acidocella sp.]